MSQMKEQEMAKEKESGSKPPLTPEESERLNQSVQKSEAQAVAQLRHQRKVRIVIPSGRGEHEKCPVTLGVNGPVLSHRAGQGGGGAGSGGLRP